MVLQLTCGQIHERHTSRAQRRDRIVVSTLRCGRNNPGSNPGHGSKLFQWRLFCLISFSYSLTCSISLSSRSYDRSCSISAKLQSRERCSGYRCCPIHCPSSRERITVYEFPTEEEWYISSVNSVYMGEIGMGNNECSKQQWGAQIANSNHPINLLYRLPQSSSPASSVGRAWDS